VSQRIPISIRHIRLSAVSDKAIEARVYWIAGPRIESGIETVNFAETYSFNYIVGAEFNEGEINEWMASNGKWDSAVFLLEKIIACTGSLRPCN
jgi:hypothetical protein